MNLVGRWLKGLGLGRHTALFSENEVNFEVLPDLTEQDLGSLGISLGRRKKLQRAITALSVNTGRADEAAGYQVVGRACVTPRAGSRTIAIWEISYASWS